VCLIGIDGSGKTTQTLILCRELRERGIRCYCLRPRYELIKLLPSSIGRLVERYIHIRPKLKTTHKRRQVFPKIRKTSHVIWISSALLLLAYATITYLLVIKPRLRGSVVICDRYVFDWFLGMNLTWSLALSRLLPKPDLSFFLDVPVTVAVSRMRSSIDKKISPSYYESLRKWYLTLAKEYGFVIVDSTLTLHDVGKEILQHVMLHLER
jgi:thymidylate kinase